MRSIEHRLQDILATIHKIEQYDQRRPTTRFDEYTGSVRIRSAKLDKEPNP